MQSNIDTKAVNHFNDLASQWWDTKGPFRTLHQINPLRLQFVQQHQSLKGQKLADIGCGAGIFSEALAQAGAKVTGIDMAADVIDVAAQHAQANGLDIDYHVSTVESFVQTHAKTYDSVTCMEMLEHVPDPEAIIAHCAELVKPGGYVFLSTLNRNIKAYLGAIVMAEHILNLLPKGTHYYDHFIKPVELVDCAVKYGLFPETMKGIRYHPLTGQFSMTGRCDINYLIALRKQDEPLNNETV